MESQDVKMDEKSKYDTFTCFAKLPTELRLKIWNENLPGPRIVRITSLFYFSGPSTDPGVGSHRLRS
jgi:hypothetical protein